MKRNIVPLVLSTVFALAILISSFALINNARAQLPQITQLIYNYNSNMPPLYISDFEEFSNRFSIKSISFCSELDEVNINEQTVTPVLTNNNFFEVTKYTIYGEDITDQNLKNRDKVAIISSTLALKLFFNIDAVGKIININDENYTIVAVYEEFDDIISNLSSDGKERIYIPYTCYKDFKQAAINTIIYANSAPSASKIEQKTLEQYYSINFSEKLKVISTFEHIIFLIIYIYVCVLALKIWWKFCKDKAEKIKNSLGNYYFLKSIKNDFTDYLLFVLVGIGIPLIIIFAFTVFDFSIFIPSKYIPYDNIFEISYYAKVIIQNSNELNSLSASGNTYYLSFYSNIFNAMLALTTGFTIISIILMENIFSFITTHKKYLLRK